MDPGRRAMISGLSKTANRDITSPRHDPSNRVSKPTRSGGSKGAAYQTEDELSRKFIADEDNFVLRQAKKKADIRVREKRAKPIDFLAFSLRFVDTDRDADFDDEDEDVEIEIPSPEDVILGIGDEIRLKELEEGITHYHTLEKNARNREYWRALEILCAEHRQSLRPLAPERRVTQHVTDDVDRIFQAKTLDQLRQLQIKIEEKLLSREDIDTDYWGELLRKIPVYIAKGTIKSVYTDVEKKRHDLLRIRNPEMAQHREQGIQLPKEQDILTEGEQRSVGPAGEPNITAPPSASYGTNPAPGTARFSNSGNDDFSQATKALYEREVARGVGENEEVFAAEETVPSSVQPQWADKHRPRKPRYFNRVQMGYEWNKYNQTHYDHDNPPPKVVQGYKFNIFYPDLIDKTKTPDYKIIREHGRKRGQSFAPAGEEDTCLIRFTAGPPYEDIAFRIVDREWDYSAKKDGGFKAEFKKGILQLHFQFKKIYYRK